MAGIGNWIGNWMADKVINNMAQKAVYEHKVHSGTANVMADNPQAYIKEGYAGNTTMYAVVSHVDAMRKQATLRLYDKNKKEVENHDLMKFLTKVNSSLRTDDLITRIITDRLTVGEYFIYKLALTAGLNKGKVLELHHLPVAETEIIEGTWMEPVRGYKVKGNYQTEMSANEVYHSMMYNPNAFDEQSLHGQSPWKAARMTVSKSNQIEITETKAFENQGPPFILGKDTSDPMLRLTTEQQDDYLKKIKKASQPENRKLPLVVKDKLYRLDLGQKLADMEIGSSDDRAVIKMCNVIHLPPILLGYGPMTYNNMIEARKAAWTDCIIPNLEDVKNCLNACLIEPVEEYAKQGLYFDFDYSDVEELQDGIKTKVDWMARAGWSKNEIRVATGKAPIENPKMDEPIVLMGESFLSDFDADLDEGEKSYDDYLK